MGTKQILQFYHGSGAFDFPDHNTWFIPELIKHINRVLKATGPQIILKDYLECDLVFDISDKDGIYAITIKYDDFLFNLDLFIVELIKKINTHLIHRFNGYGIVPIRHREKDINCLYMVFASRQEVQNGLDGFTILGTNNDYISIIPENAQTIPLITLPIPFKQLTLKHISEYYEGNHHLPVYAHMPEVLQKELEKILQLNPKNNITVLLGKIPESSLEKVEVVYKMADKVATGFVDRWALVKLGNQFNQLLKEKEHRYCLIQPDLGNYMYVYCDKTEFELLKENDFVDQDYTNIFIN
jgi:hypothetical protein